MNDVERAVLDRLRPNRQQRDEMQAKVDLLLAEMQTAVDHLGLEGKATIQGSVAKDTWIADSTDIDLFVLFPTGTDEKGMARTTKGAAKLVLKDVRERYAQHPYVIGTFQGLEVDCVPAFAVAGATERMTSVDRTPLHTQWVQDHLSPTQLDSVRLAKQWLKGVGAYGAETAIGGLSGYLVEVLIHGLEDFAGLIRWLAEGAPATGTIGRDPGPLLVPDPVDAERNCAAAVTATTLDRACEAARAYLDNAHERFFFPQPPRIETPRVLRETLEQRDAIWFGWYFSYVGARLDIVYPQFQKAAQRIAKELEAAGFHVLATGDWTQGTAVGLQWLLDATPLPESRVHKGPAIGAGENAMRFCQKWEDHPDAVGPVQEIDGRLQVEVAIPRRHAGFWLDSIIRTTDFGKHVAAATPRAFLYDDVAEVPSAWSPDVSDFVLDRRPWQR